MKRTFLLLCLALLSLGVLSGCETSGGKLEPTVAAIQRRVVKIDESVGGSLTKLNETTAALSARVEESDTQTRQLRTMAEENQVKLDELQREMKSIKTALYKSIGATASGGVLPVTPPTATVDTVTVDTPNGTAPVTPLPPVTPVATPSPAEGANLAPPASIPAATPTAPAEPAKAAMSSSDAAEAKRLYQQAQKTFANGDYAGAQQQFTDFLQRYTSADDASNAQFWVGKCHLNQDRYQEAIQAFQAVRANYPDSNKVPWALQNAAVAHARLGQKDEAIALFDEVIKNYPMSPAADGARSDLSKLRGQ